jgi:hypothetical protein
MFNRSNQKMALFVFGLAIAAVVVAPIVSDTAFAVAPQKSGNDNSQNIIGIQRSGSGS